MKLFLFLCCIGVVVCKLPKEYVINNNKFIIDLMKEMGNTHKGNILYNGLSIETLLGLTSLGAKGQTAEQIRKALHAPQPEEKFKEQVRTERTEYPKGKELLASANEIFLAKTIEVEPSFLNTATTLFRTEVRHVDFGNTEEAVKDINSRVSARTNGKITGLVKEEQIKDDTGMMLVSALHFKAILEKPFKPEETEKRDFQLTENNSVKVDTMKLTDIVLTYTSTTYNMTLLLFPYEGSEGRANLAIVVPHDVEGVDVPKNYMNGLAREVIGNYVKEYATVYLPKFKLQTTLDLIPVLQKMGITDLFTAPDLSGITKKTIKVDTMVQKVVFNLDENGSGAGVARAATTNSRTQPIPHSVPKIYRINRPFFFGVWFDEACLIAGRIMNPLEDTTY